MILLDANIFMYAAGRESPQRKPCQDYLREVVAGVHPQVSTNAEVLQEILHRYRSIGSADLGSRIVDSVISLGIPVLEVGLDEVRRARRLLEAYPTLSTREGVHLGVMEAHGITDVLTYERGFDAVEWAKRLEP